MMQLLLLFVLVIVSGSIVHDMWNDRRRKPKTRSPRWIVMSVPVGREKGYQFLDN